MSEETYRIKLLHWSATDYSFLVNETGGWVSDCEKFYEFFSIEDFNKMKEYLAQWEIHDE